MPEHEAARRRPVRGVRSAVPLMLAACFPLWADAAGAAVKGTVRNATSGRPAAGVTLTLSTFQGGMRPIDEAFSGPDGRFAFAKELPATPAEQPFLGSIRAEFEAVGYTELIRRDTNIEDIDIVVYSARGQNLPKPDGRIVILEPGESEIVVNESYQFLNASNPPVTYSSEEGTLRFFLPPEAKGIVQVSGTGPSRMPLSSTGLPAEEENIYKVDFPLKPGENRVDVTYLLPRAKGAPLALHSLYRGVPTRVAVPQGAALAGEGLNSLGREPDTRATIYDVPDAAKVLLSVTGAGRLRKAAEAASGGAGGGGEISIQPAPVAGELLWIIGLTAAIFGIGFVYLLTSGGAPPRSPKAAAAPRKKRRKA